MITYVCYICIYIYNYVKVCVLFDILCYIYILYLLLALNVKMLSKSSIMGPSCVGAVPFRRHVELFERMTLASTPHATNGHEA